jgi:hypothetical protein
LETFCKIKKLEKNTDYYNQRQRSINSLNISTIDEPIIDLIKGFLKLPYCFTLQSCYGHFLYNGQRNAHNIKKIPLSKDIRSVEYRIAYIALCIQNNKPGKKLFEELSKVPQIDPRYIQFGCAEWFWESQVNSYALQVEPERFSTKDSIFIGYEEALHIEYIRKRFFEKIGNIIQNRVIINI